MVFEKRLTEDDAESAAKLHIIAFKNFFLSTLGKKFLEQFYRSLVRRDDTVCQGYWDDRNRLIAFFVANHCHKGFYKDLAKKNALSFAVSSYFIFLKNPILLFRLAKSFSSTSKSIKVENYPYLMSICVLPEAQNLGLGKRMMEDLITHLKRKNFNGLYLTTDSDDNVSANSFYTKNGFDLTEVIYQGNRKLNVYFKVFNTNL